MSAKHDIDIDAWRKKLHTIGDTSITADYPYHTIPKSDFLNLLRLRPELASEVFTNAQIPPLSIMIEYFDPTLEDVKAVYSLCPSSVEKGDYCGRLPIEYSIRRHTGNIDIFLFLAEKYPSVLAKRPEWALGESPFLVNEACFLFESFETFKRLFDIAETYFHKTDTEFISTEVFSEAVAMASTDSGKLNYLLSKVNFVGGVFVSPFVDAPCARLLLVHLHRLTSLSIHKGSTDAGFQLLAQSLRTNTSLKRLSIRISSPTFGDGSVGDPADSLKKLTKWNATLHTLELDFYRLGIRWYAHLQDRNRGDMCIKVLHSCFNVKSTSSIENLHIENLSLSDRFLSSKGTPKCISLKNISFDEATQCEHFASGVVEKLSIKGNFGSWWHDFILLCCEESLTRLIVDPRKRATHHASKCVYKLLLKGNLEELFLAEQMMNTKICDALLPKSSRLRRFGTEWTYVDNREEVSSSFEEALVHGDNTTLTEIVGGWPFPPYIHRTVYFVRLNACGRGKCRSSTTKVDDFIEMICPVNIKLRTQVEVDRGVISIDEVHQLQYGLLLEVPGLWCHANILKRKRSSHH